MVFRCFTPSVACGSCGVWVFGSVKNNINTLTLKHLNTIKSQPDKVADDRVGAEGVGCFGVGPNRAVAVTGDEAEEA